MVQSRRVIRNLQKRERVMTPLQRINRIIAFYYKRGTNKESVNNVYRNILKKKLEQKKHLIDLMNEK